MAVGVESEGERGSGIEAGIVFVRPPVRDRGLEAVSRTVSRPRLENMAPKSPPRSSAFFCSGELGLAGDLMGSVGTLVEPVCMVNMGGRSGTAGSSRGGGMDCFFCPPNDQVREALNKEALIDFVEGPRAGPSASAGVVVLFAWRASTGEVLACISAEEGAVDALLWRDELSVEVACVVFERPLPLRCD